MGSESPEPDKHDSDQPKAKKAGTGYVLSGAQLAWHAPRTTTACNRCRKKRGRCDGEKPVCGPCRSAGAVCEYELGGDKRKPYTKAVVQAMQLRIDTLEAQLAALTGGNPSLIPSVPPALSGVGPSSASPSHAPLPGLAGDASTNATPALLSLHLTGSAGNAAAAASDAGLPPPPPLGAGSTPAGTQPGSGPTSLSFAEGSAPQVNPNPGGLDTFQGGLAVNAHGELRFYGPTSSYRAVLADSTSLLNTPTTVNAIRAFSLTRAPIPTAAPADPALPRRPPDLSPDFKARLFGLAFEYCFAHYNLVPEREFFADFQMHPFERTQFYSPFLMNCILAVGCRYLDPEEDYPQEICGLIGDPDTRGDVFVTWARHLLDQEWYNPALSTIRGLLVLGLYLAGRGFDGPCLIFVKNALTLAIDFGLNLGPHRLSMSMGVPITEELVSARRDAFWSSFCSDIIASFYIGRPPSFTPDMIDTIPPPVVPEIDFEEPLYRSSAFHWSSRLLFIASKILTGVYSLKPGITLPQRQALVPELHLLLESWYHELPSHLRASSNDPAKAPHPHIIVLQCAYNMLHISLHRPFFRRHSSDPTTNVSTEKCLVAASNIVRLVKLLRGSAGLRKAAPGIQHAAFNAGTVLAISAVEDGISDNLKQDGERRTQAKKDLKLIVQSLKEIGATWTTAHTSAGVLEALTLQWEAMSQAPSQPGVPSYADNGDISTFAAHSPASSIGTLPTQPSGLSLPIELNLAGFDPTPSAASSHVPHQHPRNHHPHQQHNPAALPKLETPSYTPTGSGSLTPQTAQAAAAAANALGMLNFPSSSGALGGTGFSRPGTSDGFGGAFGMGTGGMGVDAEAFGFGFSSMFPSFGFGEDALDLGGGGADGTDGGSYGSEEGSNGYAEGDVSMGGVKQELEGNDGEQELDLLGLLNMPQTAPPSQAPTPANPST
ncbi:hypothetical protein JCM8097_003503 [Rhodosporidiobolus ruineniae]